MTQLAFDLEELVPAQCVNRYRAVILGVHVSYLNVLHGSVKPVSSCAWADTLPELMVELGRDWCAKRAYYGQDCEGCSVEIEVFEQTFDLAKPQGERWVSERLLERITL